MFYSSFRYLCNRGIFSFRESPDLNLGPPVASLVGPVPRELLLLLPAVGIAIIRERGFRPGSLPPTAFFSVLSFRLGAGPGFIAMRAGDFCTARLAGDFFSDAGFFLFPGAAFFLGGAEEPFFAFFGTGSSNSESSSDATKSSTSESDILKLQSLGRSLSSLYAAAFFLFGFFAGNGELSLAGEDAPSELARAREASGLSLARAGDVSGECSRLDSGTNST